MGHKSIITRLTLIPFFFLMASSIILGNVSAQEKKEIVVGGVVSLTGPIAALAIDQKFAYEEAVADVNKKGGIFIKEYGKKLPVKLILQDDESDAGKAADATERLIKINKVDFILGTQYDHKNIPCAIVAEKYKVFYVVGSCTPYSWLPRKFKWSTLLFPDADGFGKTPFEIFKTLPESKRPKRIGLFLMDDPVGEGFRQFFKGAAQKYGYSSDFPVDEPLPVGAKDYSSLILKAKAKKIDAILLFANTEDSITVVRQMKELDFSVPYLHGWAGTWGIEFWDALGKDAQYVLGDGLWSEAYPYNGCKELGQKFFEKYKKRSTSAGLWYAYAQILFMAIERAGTLDGAKVRQAIVSNEFKDTLMGDVKYDENGYAVMEVGANQWWNGDQELIYPIVPGVSKPLRLAPPWDKR